jgi:hypothetical protein
MVMIAFVRGSHVQQIWEGRHFDPPGGYLGKAEVPVEECQTGYFLRFIRFLRSFVRRPGAHTRLSDSGGDLQDSPHTGFSPHSGSGLSKSSVMPLSGAEGGELTAALALCMGGIDPIQPPTPPIRSLFTKAIAQEA